MSSISNREEFLEGKEGIQSLKEIDSKKLIKYLTAGVGGLSIANLIVKNSSKIDTFVFKTFPKFLHQSDFYLLTYLPIVNWFSLTMVLSLIVGTLAEVKIVQNEMFERERRR